MKKIIIIFLIVLSFGLGLIIPFPIKIKEREDKLNPISRIEMEEKACLDGVTATNDIIYCIKIATKQWENEIENNLSKLKKISTEEQYALIENNQKLWLKQAQSDREVIDEFIEKQNRLMFLQFKYSDFQKIVEDRARFLAWIYFLHPNKENKKE